MGRLLEQCLDARIVPPEVGLILEAVEDTDLGGRQHAETDKHHPDIMQRLIATGLGGHAQLTSGCRDALAGQRLMVALIDGSQRIPQAHEFALHLVVAGG